VKIAENLPITAIEHHVGAIIFFRKCLKTHLFSRTNLLLCSRSDFVISDTIIIHFTYLQTATSSVTSLLTRNDICWATKTNPTWIFFASKSRLNILGTDYSPSPVQPVRAEQQRRLWRAPQWPPLSTWQLPESAPQSSAFRPLATTHIHPPLKMCDFLTQILKTCSFLLQFNKVKRVLKQISEIMVLLCHSLGSMFQYLQ